MPDANDSTYRFAPVPFAQDYLGLAGHIMQGRRTRMHSSLWPQRSQVAERLRRMGQDPGRQAHQAAYHALRLLVW